MTLRRPILKRHYRYGGVTIFFALTWIGLGLSPPVRFLCAGEPETRGPKTTSENYARTPDTVIPYRAFRKPYLRFFQETPPFRGTGRDAQIIEPPTSIRIGVLAPSGAAPDAELGRELTDGVTLAIEQANAADGLDGIPIEMVLRDDAGAWGSTANEIVQFRYLDDVLAVIGSIDGANTHIALRVALKVQLPMLNTATTDPTLTETGIPWIMRCMADDRQQGYALAHHIFNTCGLKKVAAFRVNDRYGRTGIAEFRDAARRLQHPLRLELRWKRGDHDFSEQLDRIVQTGVEAIVLWGNASDAAAVVREMRRRGMPQLIFGCDRLVSRSFLEKAGDAAEGVVAVASFDPTAPNPRYATFVHAFQERFEREPDSFATHAYDGANILIEAIRNGGLNRVRIRDELYSYRRYDGATGRIDFDTTLNDIGPVYIATVTHGEYAYQQAQFTKTSQAAPRTQPYRMLSDSPPVARVAEAAGTDPKQDAFRIGCFLPLDPTGQSAVRGLEMAFAEEASSHPDQVPIKLLVRDSRGVWGDNANALTTLVVDEGVLALVGSTERRGTHLMETLAARLHLPLITLCSDDPTIHAIPLPWLFSVAPAGEVVNRGFAKEFESRFGSEPTEQAAMGYDAGQLLISAIRSGGSTRTGVRKYLTTIQCHECASGSFRFDAMGRRIDRIGSGRMATLDARKNAVAKTQGDNGRKGSP